MTTNDGLYRLLQLLTGMSRNELEQLGGLPDDAATISTMAEEWHNASDHAQDGDPYGSPLCNCYRIAVKAHKLGWR